MSLASCNFLSIAIVCGVACAGGGGGGGDVGDAGGGADVVAGSAKATSALRFFICIPSSFVSLGFDSMFCAKNNHHTHYNDSLKHECCELTWNRSTASKQ